MGSDASMSSNKTTSSDERHSEEGTDSETSASGDENTRQSSLRDEVEENTRAATRRV